MNKIIFDQPKHIDEVKAQFDITSVSILTTPNMYPLVKGIESVNLAKLTLQKKSFPIKRKMDSHIEAYENAMLRHWEVTKKKLVALKNKIKDIKKMSYNNVATIDAIGRIPSQYKKLFVETADKYDLNLSILNKIVLNSSLMVNARYDARKNLMEFNPDYFEQHGMIRIGDSGEYISEISKTFIHEYGHAFWYNSLTEEERRYWSSLAKFLTREQLTGDMSQYIVGEKKRFDGSTMYSPYYTMRDEAFVSVYARFNTREDFAECYLYYKVAPKTLERINPNKFAFLVDKVGNRMSKDMEKAFAPEVDNPREFRDDVIDDLDDMKDDLSQKAKDHLTIAYNLGRQKGAFYAATVFDPKLSQRDREKIQQIISRNDEYLDEFMDDLSDEYDNVLFDMSPVGMVEGIKEYDSVDDFDNAFNEVMDTQEHRLSVYAINGLSLALISGMVEVTKEDFGGGFWHTSLDDRVCDGCDRLDGQWMSYDEFLDLYGNNDCDGNCRCGELFEPAEPPEGGSLELMSKRSKCSCSVHKADKVVAVDYHGTIKVNDQPNKEVVDKLKEMRANGYHIIVYTSGITRNPGIIGGITNWLNDRQIPFDEVWQRQGKPDADIYIDDKAIRPDEVTNLEV